MKQIQNSHHMLMPNADPIFVRASVASVCNLNCVYCPKEEGMENRVPVSLMGNKLTTEEYVRNLSHLARNGINGVSFTGGEPTINRDLPSLIKAVRPLFERVELTTNGFRLKEILPEVTGYLDILKVSLDAVDPNMVRRITQGTSREWVRATTAIRLACTAGLQVGVNVVVMRSNLSQIEGILQLCRTINRETNGNAYVSLLDLYYSSTRHRFWEQEFLPLGSLETEFSNKYGSPIVHERFGCRFLWFDADGVRVRFKDSFSATQRAAKCNNCAKYCQEGIYGLKHSVEGWVTTCPTGDWSYGVHLAPGLSTEEADSRLAGLLSDIHSAKPDPNSFSKMLKLHQLQPVLLEPPELSPANREAIPLHVIS